MRGIWVHFFYRYMFQFIATLTTGLFAGASIYISLVEHPARMSCGITLAIKEFSPSYKRASIMQAALAAIASICALIEWFITPAIEWLLGGLLIGAVIPFTLIVIFPTNKRLLDPSLDKDSGEAKLLMDRWEKLHAVRSILSFISLLIFLYALILKESS